MLDMNNTKNFHMELDRDISHGAVGYTTTEDPDTSHGAVGYDGEGCF
jgi:hypothetical protein